ncbi:MAG: PEP/pyruvate-binding domain-containing protein [Xenococcaceae cyanobacterium MO_188.B29]|nr:PEP/pyruvate-binding domain-containing protein [Xenococcaceae cyanobacterium MO_188.B29]
MNHIYWLSQLKSSEKYLVGEKVLILSQLLQSGYPILPGYIIGTPVLKEFLQTLDSSQSLIGNLSDSSLYVDVDNYQALQSFAQKSRQIITETEFPLGWQEAIFNSAQKLNSPTLILRPSLVIPSDLKQRHIGLWNSHLCLSQPEAISWGIKQVWGELFSAKSIFYWQKLGISLDELDLAILIQPFKGAIASGTVEIEPQSIHIRATWGLGHSWLRGEVEPDSYHIDRTTSTIKSQQLGNKVIAYNLLAEDEKIAQQQQILITELVSEQKQEQYALDDAGVKTLVKLVEQVVAKDNKIEYLEWILSSENYDLNEPQFFLTQSNYYPSALTNYISSLSGWEQNSPPAYLKGLGVAPGKVTAPVFLLTNLTEEFSEIPFGSILVTKKIMPIHIPLLHRVAGVITQEGGVASHGAIVARELSIPAIAGVKEVTHLLQSGEYILLDGDSGEIYRVREADMKQEQERQPQTPIANLPASFPDYPIATQLMVNLSQPNSIALADNLPVDGVGLIRSELMLADLIFSQPKETWFDRAEQSKFQETLTNILRQIAKAFFPRPIFYRSLDWQSVDSLLGSRGTYRYQQDSTLFTLELAALAQIMEEGYANFNLILPFVRSVREFRFCHRLVESAGLTEYPDFQLWIMAEVPSVIFLLSEYVRAGVQGLAIGTNDLTQLLLGVDREQEHFNRQGFNANHPAMLKALEQLLSCAKAEGIPCSICGQAPVQYPTLIDKLIQWEITSISVETQAVMQTYRAIARAEQRLLLSKMRKD